MGCVIPHQSNAVNIPHQTNAGLIPVQYYMLKHNFQESKDFHNPAYPDILYLLWPYALPCFSFIGCSA